MKRIVLFITWAGFLWVKPAFGQINESDTAKWQLRASVNGNYQKGNVDILVVRSRLDFLYAPQKDIVFKTQNNSLYQAFYDKKADNDVYSRNYLYFRPLSKVYPFAIGYVSTNFRRKIDMRYFVGLGGTVQLVNTKYNVVKMSLSTVYERTTFTESKFNFLEYNGNDYIKLWRATAYISGTHLLFGQRIRLYYDAYVQPALGKGNKNNYRTQFDIGFDVPVWKGLSLNALYTFTHENVVIQKIKNDDKILAFGLSYQLKINH